jgi:hypothetical protein
MTRPDPRPEPIKPDTGEWLGISEAGWQGVATAWKIIGVLILIAFVIEAVSR